MVKKMLLCFRLEKRFLPYFLIGALAFSTLFNYRCADELVEPDPKKPVAMLITEPIEGDAPLEVSFDGSMSYAREGYLEKYLWDFGDGETDSTSGAWVKHLYEEAGEYNASLVVVDDQGQESNKASEKIVVTENIVSLGQIAFWSMTMTGEVWPQDIYSGDVIVRVRDDNIELRDIKRLTTDPGQDLEPAWSPDGSKIVFTSNRDGKIRLYIMNANGTEQTILTPSIEHASGPSWSPDGAKIAFGYRDSGFAGIGIINPDENSFIPIYSELEGGRPPGGPTWSPDCSEIAFRKYINGNWEIFLMNADGSNLRNLTDNPDYDVSPDWSPDGSRIAFVSDPNPSDGFFELEIYLINPDGSNKIQLTNNSAKELDPDWSPCGSKIVFGRRESLATTQDIWIINADGTNERKVLESEGHERYPAWGPKIDEENILNLF